MLQRRAPNRNKPNFNVTLADPDPKYLGCWKSGLGSLRPDRRREAATGGQSSSFKLAHFVAPTFRSAFGQMPG